MLVGMSMGRRAAKAVISALEAAKGLHGNLRRSLVRTGTVPHNVDRLIEKTQEAARFAHDRVAEADALIRPPDVAKPGPYTQTLLHALDDLVQIAKELPVRMAAVSDDPKGYEEWCSLLNLIAVHASLIEPRLMKRMFRTARSAFN